MVRFIRVSETGDVNCLVKGQLEELSTEDGSSLQDLLAKGWTVSAMTALNTGFVLIALEGAG